MESVIINQMLRTSATYTHLSLCLTACCERSDFHIRKICRDEHRAETQSDCRREAKMFDKDLLGSKQPCRWYGIAIAIFVLKSAVFRIL